MQDETSLGAEIWGFFTKLSSYIMPVVLGLFGTIGNILYSQRKLTRWQVVGIIFISLWYGWIASVACEAYQWTHVRHILPGAVTMFGEYINTWLLHNYKKYLNRIVDAIFKRNEK